MIVTEEEAMTKWCGPGMANSTTDVWCVASGCMAWRWLRRTSAFWGTPILQPSVTAEPARPPSLPADYIWVPPSGSKETGYWQQPEGPPRGYCGLAGKPEGET